MYLSSSSLACLDLAESWQGKIHPNEESRIWYGHL
jgi:hypothetical protein